MIVSVEGNIGSGKSSALESLAARGFRVRPEPVDEWGDLLDLYYADPAAWSLAFNLKVLHSFAMVDRSSPCVIERSPAACRHVFGQLAYNDNHLSPAAWDVFKDYYDFLGWEPDAYVYIDAPASACHERMATRGRQCESSVSEEYLARIEFQYENLLRFTKVPVFRVDGTQAPGDVVRDIESIISSL
jgi:NADH dehydrogenase (ubiquinone) 1 alpha subcomplex subunit 10